jgi:hypothetical protein
VLSLVFDGLDKTSISRLHDIAVAAPSLSTFDLRGRDLEVRALAADDPALLPSSRRPTQILFGAAKISGADLDYMPGMRTLTAGIGAGGAVICRIGRRDPMGQRVFDDVGVDVADPVAVDDLTPEGYHRWLAQTALMGLAARCAPYRDLPPAEIERVPDELRGVMYPVN